MSDNNDRVQLRITREGKHLLAEGYLRKDAVFWTNRRNAHQYVNVLKIAEPVGGAIGGSEHQAFGPSETKPAAPSEKKTDFFDAEPAGPSTDSARSPEPGPAAPSSVSEADPVLTQPSAPGSRRRRGKKA